jgi:hypothetical protein
MLYSLRNVALASNTVVNGQSYIFHALHAFEYCTDLLHIFEVEAIEIALKNRFNELMWLKMCGHIFYHLILCVLTSDVSKTTRTMTTLTMRVKRMTMFRMLMIIILQTATTATMIV